MKLAELRKEKGLSQREFAKIFNISSGNVCDYEKGRVQPSIERLINFADFFQVSIDYLVDRENDLGLIEVKGAQLTRSESELLKLFRRLNERQQDRVLGYMENMAS